MKPLRNFVLRLGELSIPVGLVSTASEQDEKLFRVLHADCKTPTQLRVFCPADERVLDPNETVTAWQVAQGQYLELTDQELARLRPADSSLMPITGFVPAGELDPLLVKKRYQLAPSKTIVGAPAYIALATAIDAHEVVALARFNAWNSEQLAAIAARHGVLELATLHFAEDVQLDQADQIAEQLAEARVSDLAAGLMHEIVARYTRHLEEADLASHNRPRTRALLEAKLAGQPIVEPDQATVEPESAMPVDLESALRRTLKAAPRKRGRRRQPAPA